MNGKAREAMMMEDSVCLLEDLAFQFSHQDHSNEFKLINKERRQLQHEFKIYLEKYFKDLLGKSVDHIKITIWADLLIIQGEGFLTQPEKYIATTPKGSTLVKASRMQVAKQCAVDNTAYFEEKLGAKCIYQTFDVDANKNFWIQVIVFDQLLIDQ